MNTTKRVIAKAKELIDAAPHGKRWAELCREVSAAFPEITPTIAGHMLFGFRSELPDAYYNPVRGLYRNVQFKTTDEAWPPESAEAKEKVVAKAKELIDGAPQGKRWAELCREVSAAFSEITPKRISYALFEFRTDLPEAYYNPVRGLYRSARFRTTDEVWPPESSQAKEKVIAKAKQLIDAARHGKRWTELCGEVSAAFPEITLKRIEHILSEFRTDLPEAYYNPARGLYRSVQFKTIDEVWPPESAEAKEKVVAKAKELIDAAPDGKRWSGLCREISAAFPEITPKRINHILSEFRTNLPEAYYNPVRGLYRSVRFKATDEAQLTGGGKTRKAGKIREEDFYQPFGDWLVNELEEATKAIALGGCVFKDKWGTPDVIAIWEAQRSDIITAPTEIICAEIKLDVSGLITAFGQCCSYKLFSHKSYLVVPKTSSEEDISRLDSLALIFGIGLVLFEPDDPNQPQFTIKTRASREEPDMFYVNKYLRLVENKLFGYTQEA